MGASGISWGELLIILLIVLLVFGSGKFARLGTDLGAAVRGFRNAMKGGAGEDDDAKPPPPSGGGA